jgi:hypothetical protein
MLGSFHVNMGPSAKGGWCSTKTWLHLCGAGVKGYPNIVL